MRWPRLIVLCCGLLLAGAACSTPPPPNGTAPGGWTLEVTTPDMSVGAPQRFEVVLSQTTDTGTRPVVFGTLHLSFSYLGGDGSGAPDARGTVTARYLALPGTPASGTGPALSDRAVARGAYIADGVTFDAPGVWEATGSGSVAAVGQVSVTSPFRVSASPAIPSIGDAAIPVDNPTIGSHAPPSEIDSRAVGNNPVPDPSLHRWSIKAALAAHLPILVLFSTPAYCTSQVCGPQTDEMAALAKTYANRAAFIHVEVWRNFESGALSPSAKAWLLRGGVLNEPWLYLIDSHGTIVDRWPPLVIDWAQVASELSKLPTIP